MTRRSVPSKAQVRAWRVSPAAPAEPGGATEPARRGDPMHGYTLRDLDRLARRAVAIDRNWFPGGDRNDQYEAAWHGIAEYLCAADEPPTEFDLLNAGRAVLKDDQQKHQQMLGTRRSGTYTGANFARYWDWHSHPAPSPEDSVVERLALRQIMATLAPSHVAALTTLAALDDAGATADALGITYQATKDRPRRARANFRGHWYAPEAPPPMYREISTIADRARESLREKCAHGHAMTPENTQWEKSRKTGRAPVAHCRTCERDRSKRRVAASREEAGGAR